MEKRKLEAALKEVENAVTKLGEIVDDERDAWDERSEKWQESDAGQTAESYLDMLEGAKDEIEQGMNSLTELIDTL